LKVQSSWDLVPIYDVIATLKGSTYPDEWILRGNHEDAWVFGAGDPISGLVGLLEEAHGVSKLVKDGWKPKRTLVYCAWDGEEEGLFGSTEWVETHLDELRRKAVVYVNSDGNGRGFFYAAGSHTLQRFVNQVARDVKDPEYNITVEDRRRATMIAEASSTEREEIRSSSDLPIGALGSGSDYSPFLQHLGIAALNVGYGGEDPGGSYHSAYDSFDFYVRFGDPEFKYELLLAQTGGRIMLRFANAEVLPFEFSEFTQTVGKYVKEVTKLAGSMRDATAETNREIRDNTLRWDADPQKTFIVPAEKPPVPYLNFAPLENALSELERNTHDVGSMLDHAGDSLASDRVAALNEALKGFEHSLTLEKGLSGRPWYIHQLYAPGQYTGYGVKTLPAVREAIELRKWGEADTQIAVVAKVLSHSAEVVGRVHGLLSGPHQASR
jgi:N-acetylated-alpha-linked acidic dipeptidase